MTEGGRDEAERLSRQARRDGDVPLQPDQLVGLTEADARARVEAAGGTFEGHEPGAVLTMEFRANRVRAVLEKGRVVNASLG
jgi:hypothetical protein